MSLRGIQARQLARARDRRARAGRAAGRAVRPGPGGRPRRSRHGRSEGRRPALRAPGRRKGEGENDGVRMCPKLRPGRHNSIFLSI